MTGTVLIALLKHIGVTGCAIIGMLFFYEGIPGAHRIPFLTSLPVIGDLTTGRVHTYADEQVRIEKGKCDDRVANMVSAAEYAALEARLKRERLLREMAQRLNEQAAKQTQMAIRERDAARADVERRIAEDKGDGCVWTEEDDQWREQ